MSDKNRLAQKDPSGLTQFERADAARADLADLLDAQLSPLGIAALNELDLLPAQTVLDIGCGAGQSILQIYESVGRTGSIIGVDIGRRVLDVARTRTAHLSNVTLIQEDAAHLQLPAQSLDAIFSRFGVMFFDEPVAAFVNFKRMLRPGGKLSFVCWRSIQENELDHLPLEAAELAKGADQTPFSFEKPDTIQQTLVAAGFGEIAINKFDRTVSCGGIENTLKVLTSVGALGAILRKEPSLKKDAEPKVRKALQSRLNKTGDVELEAATWIVRATAH